MTTRLRRSIDEPIREGLTWNELWKGPDEGLIWCWERGRQYRVGLGPLNSTRRLSEYYRETLT